jgi:ABC-type multidrug transport system ATPase subunit
MKVSLTDAGKRFNREWIFRHFNYRFENGNSYAIIGPNGSGKTTLLQVISGAVQLSEGKISPEIDGKDLDTDHLYQYVSISAPYLEIIEEMTLKEFLDFHKQFKPLLPGIATPDIIKIIGLENAAGKQIRYYSSGMKQRAKLAQAIFSDTPVLLLDEPCTNLDENGIALYHDLIRKYCHERLVIISSNDKIEYEFCDQRINVTDYKN